MSSRMPFKQKSRRGIGKVLAIAVLTVAALSWMISAWAVPVAAQSLFDDPTPSDSSTFGDDFGRSSLYDREVYVKWKQGSSSKDEFSFWGPDSLQSVAGDRVVDQMLNVFGISPVQSNVSDYVSTDYDDDPPQRQGSIDQHLLVKGENWSRTFNAAGVVDVARQAGFDSVSLELCPLADSTVKAADSFQTNDKCRTWTWPTSARLTSANSITLTEHPDSSHFRNVVNQLMVWVLVISVIMTALAVLLQRLAMKELKTANLVLSILFVAGGTIAVTTAMFVFGLGVGSLHDVLLVDEAGYSTHALLIFLPSMLVALPFVLPAIAFVLAKPRSIHVSTQPQHQSPGTGIPAWMVSDTVAQAKQGPSQQPGWSAQSPTPPVTPGYQPPTSPESPRQSWEPPQSPSPEPPPSVQPEVAPEQQQQPPQPPRWDPPA